MERRYQANKKYSADSTIIYTVPDDIQSLTKLKRLRKAKCISIMDELERNVALYPDSTAVVSGKTDSFYFNKNKIAYIRQHGLQSNRMQFLPAK